MSTNLFSSKSRISASGGNVSCKFEYVKRVLSKIAKYSVAAFASGMLAFGAVSPAQAEDANARAIINSTELLNFISAVVPVALPNILQNIQNGEVKRFAPEYPVWILESENNTILYYQGQKSFVGQNANRLIDDNGFRFGQRALDQGKNSRSTWIRLTLTGKDYRAYCASKAPYVVCSLVP